ncbi:MAG: hypothetical protein R3E53_03015 [Myxococcota bacterium]
MIDLEHVLADMAGQIRRLSGPGRADPAELATRSGVAGSDPQVESQQMVPTVSVLLKIARASAGDPPS